LMVVSLASFLWINCPSTPQNASQMSTPMTIATTAQEPADEKEFEGIPTGSHRLVQRFVRLVTDFIPVRP
jgi:hypothetical protein